jgi:hypothetical protein
MNRHFLKLALVCGISLTAISPSHAVTISESLLDDKVHIVKLDGEIKPGDSARVQNVLAKALRDEKRRVVISINSGGGSVQDGADISGMIFDEKLPLAVHRDCESSCFMIFAAASVKLVGPETRIGVHSVKDSRFGENGDAMALTVVMARLYEKYKVPANIIGQTITHPPEKMYYLTHDDMTAMGANIAK